MEFAGAPVPVIFGCHPKVFKAVHEYELSSIKSEVVIINVDEDKWIWENQVSFPTPHVDYLKSKLGDLSKSTTKFKEYKNDDYVDITDDSVKSIKLQVMVWLEINMRIKKVFVNLMILILGHYQDYLNNKNGSEFDYEEYIKSALPENREFYHAFVRTQMFNTFLKDSWESNSNEMKEFKNYLSILYSTNPRHPQSVDATQCDDRQSDV